MDGHNRRLILFSALSVSGTFALKSVFRVATTRLGGYFGFAADH